jgi:hypothetical protein
MGGKAQKKFLISKVHAKYSTHLIFLFYYLNNITKLLTMAFPLIFPSIRPVQFELLYTALAAMFSSVRVDFGRPPLSLSSTSSLLSRNRERLLKTFDQFRAFCTNNNVSVADSPALKQNFMANLCSCPPSTTCKEN